MEDEELDTEVLVGTREMGELELGDTCTVVLDGVLDELDV